MLGDKPPAHVPRNEFFKFSYRLFDVCDCFDCRFFIMNITTVNQMASMFNGFSTKITFFSSTRLNFYLIRAFSKVSKVSK